MKLFILIATLLTSGIALAELPPPGTARKGKITVDPNNKGEVFEYDLEKQKVVNRATARAFNQGVKAEVARLKRENERLRRENDRLADQARNLPTPVYSEVRQAPATPRVEPKLNRVTLLAGMGPDSLTARRKSHRNGTEIGITEGIVLSGQYSRLITDKFSLTGQVISPVRTEKPELSVLVGGGLDF